MPRPQLILDKCVLQGSSTSALSEANNKFRICLTDTLLYEIQTDSKGESKKWLGILLATVEDNWFPSSGDILTWEITRGYSGTNFLGIPGVVRTINDAYESEPEEVIRKYEETMAGIGAVRHHPDDEQDFRTLRELKGKDPEFYRHVEVNETARTHLEQEAEKSWREFAIQNQLEVSDHFLPTSSWLCYGVIMSQAAFLRWKFSRRGDFPADPKKPANPALDMFYIGYMSLADGLLSNDKDMLRLSWAVWPDKRKHLYTYDQTRREIVHFVPEWER